MTSPDNFREMACPRHKLNTWLEWNGLQRKAMLTMAAVRGVCVCVCVCVCWKAKVRPLNWILCTVGLTIISSLYFGN